MGGISEYKTADGKRYRARWRDPDRRQNERGGFATKRAARAFLASVEVGIARREYVDPHSGRATVEEVAETWLANKRAVLKPSSFRSLDVAWNVYVRPRWGGTPVRNIQPSAVETWGTQLGAGEAITERSTAHTPRAPSPRPLSCARSASSRASSTRL